MAMRARYDLSQTNLSPIEINIIDLIRKEGPFSRTNLSERLGYSRARVTTFVNRLMDHGLVIESGEGASSGGRRPLNLEVNGRFGFVLGIDIGATSIDVAVADFKGDILAHAAEPADVRADAEVVLARCAEIALDLLCEVQGSPEEVVAVGVGVPGPVEFARGILIAPPLMPSWEAFQIRDYLNRHFPAAVVVVDNDVNVMALGEQRAGLGKGVDHSIFVKIGTGIGAGIIANGKIYRGANGAAGNIGHISVDPQGLTCHCGNKGCLEAVAAGPPIARLARQAADRGESEFIANRLLENDGRLTAMDVSDAAAAGDRAAVDIIRQSGALIGSVLSGLVEFFNPSLILIGGGVSRIGFGLLSSIRQSILGRSNPLSTRDLRIEYSALAEMAGVTGAIWLTFDHIFIGQKRVPAK